MITVCVLRAWGNVLELYVVLLHKLVQKVPTYVQQPVCGVTDGMNCARYWPFRCLGMCDMPIVTHRKNAVQNYDLNQTYKIMLETKHTRSWSRCIIEYAKHLD